MKRSLLSKLAGAAVLLLSAWPAAADTVPVSTIDDGLSWGRNYWSRPHNTYERAHFGKLTDALDAGHRVIELDVYDQGNLVVKHNPGDSNTGNNCRGGAGGTLRECLRDIKQWSDAHQDYRPVVVQLDLKTDDLIGGWGASRRAELNTAVAQELDPSGTSSRIFTPGKLHMWTGYGSIREGVAQKGWPSINELRGKIIVLMMGGPLGRKNQMMDSYVRQFDSAAQIFVCPEVGEPKHFYSNGNAKDFSDPNTNRWVVCGNQQAEKYWYKNTATAKANNQLVNLWHSDANHFENFHNMYLAAGWGASFISRETRQEFDFKARPDGRRSTASVGFILVTEANTSMCLDVNGGYTNGSAIVTRPCSASTTKWHYSDEAQLRPVGGNAYCLDIKGGNGNHADPLHLWNCDGGASEKWQLRTDGRFVGMNGRCMDIINTNSGTQAEIRNCVGHVNQRFTNQMDINAQNTAF